MIYFGSEKPYILGAIRFWNYSKTPARGVHELAISFDDRVIFKVKVKKKKGYLRKASNDGQETVVVFYQDQ